MSVRAVHWHEGMFLRPHHFQLAERHARHLNARDAKWNVHHNWGLRHIDLDLDALSNYRLVVRDLKARLRDGTTISVPEDNTLHTLDLKSAFERDTSVIVYLAVPVVYQGRANIAVNSSQDGQRYFIDTQDLEDENTGINPQNIQVRLLNLKLLLSTQDTTGYETLPIARIEKSASADSVPQLDRSYIPPLLATDGWKPLETEILHNIYDRLGKKLELLAHQVVSRGITFDSSSQGDRLLFEQLRVLNEAMALFHTMFFTQGIHPLPVYLELSRLVGQLAIFGAQRRPPELPRYDHDDLGTCFYRAKQHIDALLNIIVEPEYKERPFIGAGLRMQVALEPSWLESIWNMFVGVQSPLTPEDCRNLLMKPGRLDMKIGSSDRVDDIFRLGQAGLRFAYCSTPPRALPSLPGLIYFQIDRNSQKEEWQNAQKSLSIAIRLNENLVVGNIQGQRVLTIKTGGQHTTMQFTLFVVPQEK